jgi:hypothetical protein
LVVVVVVVVVDILSDFHCIYFSTQHFSAALTNVYEAQDITHVPVQIK